MLNKESLNKSVLSLVKGEPPIAQRVNCSCQGIRSTACPRPWEGGFHFTWGLLHVFNCHQEKEKKKKERGLHEPKELLGRGQLLSGAGKSKQIRAEALLHPVNSSVFSPHRAACGGNSYLLHGTHTLPSSATEPQKGRICSAFRCENQSCHYRASESHGSFKLALGLFFRGKAGSTFPTQNPAPLRVWHSLHSAVHQNFWKKTLSDFSDREKTKMYLVLATFLETA